MNAQQMYALNLNQVANAILHSGDQRTILVQGHMGTGKSTLLKMLADTLPTHVPCYFDCTTKDLGDIAIPNFKSLGDDADFVRFVPNEELGIHHNKPVILMFDEFGKANPAVKQGVRRTMLERMVGGYELQGSIVFATTNLGAEGVGDVLMSHQRNAITVVTLRKPNNVEWIEDYQQQHRSRPSSAGPRTTHICSMGSRTSKIQKTTPTSSIPRRNVRRLLLRVRWKPPVTTCTSVTC